MAKRPIAVDLFAGAGGLSLGLQLAGFDVAAAIEFDPHHAETHRRNFPNCVVVERDAAKVTATQLFEAQPRLRSGIDLVAGGPPCQGFSVMGLRKATDPRNGLIGEFARLVIELNPKTFVMENVPGILAPKYRTRLNRALARLRRAGYRVAEPIVLDASDYGVPQRRKRVFIIGARGRTKLPVLPPPKATRSPTVWDALRDLPDVEAHEALAVDDVYKGRLGRPSEYATALRVKRNVGLTGCLRPTHSHDVLVRFAATLPGSREPISRFERLAKDGVAGTLRAGTTYERGKYMAPRPIHPVQDRCITVREAARLHSFPDSFAFHPTRWHGFREVGNSVPPNLARAVGAAVLQVL